MKRAFGIATLVFLAPLALLVITEPPSWAAFALVLGLVVLASSLVAKSKRVAIAGAIIFALPFARVVTTKRAGDVRVIDRVIPERDLSINATRMMAWTHFMKDPDVPLLPDAMRSAYDEMGKNEGDLPSPVVATYLGLEHANASDTIEFSANGKDAVVFLHGYAGNFTLSCWLLARAATSANMTTVCPSTRWVGDWWSADGEAIARASIASLHARGFKNIFLAGLSNGGIGASRIARHFQTEIAGLILISGADPEAAAVNVPTLVIQGRSDTQIPAAVAREYASKHGAKYVELDAGHFALLVDRNRAARAITDWLKSN